MKKITHLILGCLLALSLFNPVSAATYTTNGQEVTIVTATSKLDSNDIILELAPGTYKAGEYELLAHEGVYDASVAQNNLKWVVASTFTLSSSEVADLKTKSINKKVTTTFDTMASNIRLFVGTGNAGSSSSSAPSTGVPTDLNEILSSGLDLGPYMTSNPLNVYLNSRVTTFSCSSTGIYIEGYSFVKDRTINAASGNNSLWRELIFVNEAYPDADHAYRMKVTTTYNGAFLTRNTTLNPTGRYNYSAATWKVNINYNNINNYKQVPSKMAAGTYRVYIRVSDGKQSALLPLRDITLSDGSNLSSKTNSSFSYVNNNSDGKANFKLTIR